MNYLGQALDILLSTARQITAALKTMYDKAQILHYSMIQDSSLPVAQSVKHDIRKSQGHWFDSQRGQELIKCVP